MTGPSHLRHVAAELRRIAGDSPRDVPASYRATAELLDAAADSVEEAEGRFEAVLQQARAWAFGASTQKTIAHDIGRLLGSVPGWGSVVAALEAKLSALDELRDHVAVQDGLLLAQADELRAQCRPGAAEEVEARMSPQARRVRWAQLVARESSCDG